MSVYCYRGDILFTIYGRNLIFGHKLHIGTPYRGKRFLTHQIPTSCLPTLLVFIHIEHIYGGYLFCLFFYNFISKHLNTECYLPTWFHLWKYINNHYSIRFHFINFHETLVARWLFLINFTVFILFVLLLHCGSYDPFNKWYLPWVVFVR